jgi:hypothetical protein
MIIEETKVFFGENGITATSARHLANRVKEEIRSIESKMNNVSFYDTSVELLDSTVEKTLSKGVHSYFLLELENNFEYIGKMHSFMAWLNEAIKAKDLNTKTINSISLEIYCEMEGLELPKRPKNVQLTTFEEVLGKLSVRERQEYLYLNAHASQIGKYIVDGNFSKAKREYERIKSNPIEIKGEGKNAMIYKYVSSVNEDTLEQVHVLLMEKNRSLNARLNSIKYRIEQEVLDFNQLETKRYGRELEEYNNGISLYLNKLDKWRNDALNEVRKLKIVIPNELNDIYEKLKSND